jgi:16S rRNA (cytosine1402-N4)-methyltransferase
MNPSRGMTAAQLIERSSEEQLAAMLDENADEPYADVIAGLLKQQSLWTTDAVDGVVREGLVAAVPHLIEADATLSVRRTFQALRIAVNDEYAVLDALLRSLPQCLSPGSRVAILTFHSGEDRRVKKAFQAGQRDGVYAEVADEVGRATADERRANPRAASAKLRWAVRSLSPWEGL